MGLTFVDLGVYEIDPNAATKVPIDVARRYRALPIKVAEDELVVAMADPNDIFAIDDISIMSGFDVRPVVALESDILAALDKFAASQANVDDMVGDLEEAMSIGLDEREDEEDDENTAVARLMNQIVTEAIRQGAGDIYIEPYETEMRVRYRIDGVCREIFTMPKKMHRQLISRLKITCGMDIAEKRIPRTADSA